MRAVTLTTLPLLAVLAACGPQTAGSSPTASMSFASSQPFGAPLPGCSVDRDTPTPPWEIVDPRDEYYGAETDPMSTALDGFAAAMQTLTVRAASDPAAEAQLRQSILAWARADALRWPRDWNAGRDSGPATVYFTAHTIAPTAIAYGTWKSSFSPDEQAIVEGWLDRVLERTGNNPRMRGWNENKKFLYGVGLMAYGIAAENTDAFNRAVRIYQRGIDAMRPDGSIPGDTERGGSAIHYVNTAVSSLVAMAEMAAGQGVDLYSYASGGTDLHDAVRYIADATRDQDLIIQYARNSDPDTGSFRAYSITNQRRDWVEKQNANWIIFYHDRFPARSAQAGLMALSSYARDPRNETHPPSGAIAPCFVR
ncbi:alginate lyase family protein [Pontivivens insulae]|uniref:Polysaccharide lyase n=1 Tax=Pontivivens insulae TaxID=1639689 RepID=A0A2R8A8H7_9RHOB|nr:alginate lyase family protein [Pontivivens insulae]RED18633.1 alginate lyase [Pontivivens insulae]SPF28531.1 Polysaccharide lyase [Pontivivens insulae]